MDIYNLCKRDDDVQNLWLLLHEKGHMAIFFFNIQGADNSGWNWLIHPNLNLFSILWIYAICANLRKCPPKMWPLSGYQGGCRQTGVLDCHGNQFKWQACIKIINFNSPNWNKIFITFKFKLLCHFWRQQLLKYWQNRERWINEKWPIQLVLHFTQVG